MSSPDHGPLGVWRICVAVNFDCDRFLERPGGLLGPDAFLSSAHDAERGETTFLRRTWSMAGPVSRKFRAQSKGVFFEVRAWGGACAYNTNRFIYISES